MPSKDELREQLRTALRRFEDERDRRYTEVDIEKEKALKIKESADLTALTLARDIQIFKDEKANELRSQIERERGTYATQSDIRAVTDKFETQMAPIIEFVSSQRGKGAGLSSAWGIMVTLVGLGIAIITILIAIKP